MVDSQTTPIFMAATGYRVVDEVDILHCPSILTSSRMFIDPVAISIDMCHDIYK
jgi:hypothetical protein